MRNLNAFKSVNSSVTSISITVHDFAVKVNFVFVVDSIKTTVTNKCQGRIGILLTNKYGIMIPAKGLTA